MALTQIKTTGIADSAVTTAKINDDAVTDAKVADAITVTGAQTGITSVGTLGSTSISTSSAQTALSVTSSQDASNKRGASFVMGGSNASMDFGIFVDAGSNVTSGSVIKGISRHASFTGELLTLDCDTSASGATLINAKDAGTSKFIVKADGSVGIGTDNPSEILSVYSTGNGEISAERASGTKILIQAQSANGKIGTTTNHNLGLNTNGSTRMTIDTSGNVFVTKTSSDLNTVGHEFGSSGYAYHTRDGNNPLYLHRKTSNGSILSFYKDNTNVGTIGSEGGDSLYIQSGTSSGSGLHFHPTGGFIRPARNGVATDNVIDLGHSNQRFKDFYLSGGAYIGGTSGANYLDDYEEGYHSYSITGSGGGTWTIRSGWSKFQYTKIGRIVNVSGKFETYGYSGTRSGELRISLPFTPVPNLDENAEVSCGTIILNRAGSSLSNHMVAFLNGGQSSISIMIHNESGGNETFVQASNCDGYLEGLLNITYVAGA